MRMTGEEKTVAAQRRRRPGGEPDDVCSDHGPMTAGLSTRPVIPRFTTHASFTTHATLAPLAEVPTPGVAVSGASPSLPATEFRVGPDGIDRPAPAVVPVPEQQGLPETPAEGESDNRVLIDTLVAGAVKGDSRARDELLALIHPLVLKYCRARLGRQESLMGSADDVAQDVCMAVVSALPNYQLKGLSFRAFVYGIAAHKVTDAFRAIGRNRTEPVAELPEFPVAAAGPEHHVLAAERSVALGALLAHLAPRQREVLVLRLAVGMSAEETAQALRSTPGAVRVTQHRALARLRRILQEGQTAALPVADPALDDAAQEVTPK
jgi:RNA polymerase sigma-70 factor (ECF subfamily)